MRFSTFLRVGRAESCLCPLWPHLRVQAKASERASPKTNSSEANTNKRGHKNSSVIRDGDYGRGLLAIRHTLRLARACFFPGLTVLVVFLGANLALLGYLIAKAVRSISEATHKKAARNMPAAASDRGHTRLAVRSARQAHHSGLSHFACLAECDGFRPE